MTNVVGIGLSKKRESALEIKDNNDDIIYDLYKEGKVNHNPYAEDEYFEGSIIEVPTACFTHKQVYKVGA